MIEKILRKAKKLVLNYKMNRYGSVSYAQCGEDLIVNFILNNIRTKRPSYLDVGAHHAVFLSNTYLFYKNGCTGVCVEPDPELCSNFENKRPQDTCLRVGVGTSDEKEMDLYLMSSRTLNTCSKSEAEKYEKTGKTKIEKVIKVPLLNINDIIEKNFDKAPNFISIDVEGLDLEILKSLDFSKFRPEVFCVETIKVEDGVEKKSIEIIELMQKNGYMIFADTYMNTIFVEKKKWEERLL